MINRAAFKVAIIFFCMYWPFIIVGSLYGYGLGWSGEGKNILEKGIVGLLKILSSFPGGLFVNCLAWSIIIYFISLIIIKRKAI
jgi:hypothetical protein